MCAVESSSTIAATCNPLGALPEAVENARVIVFGELHGTNESPDFVGRFLCTAAMAGEPLVLALEIPTEEQSRIDSFLASGGDDRAVDDLLSGPFWHREFHDGRSSSAMVRLIRFASQLKADGKSVSVLAFAAYDNRSGDEAMADAIASALALNPSSRAVVLTGAGHAATTVGTSWDPDFRPLGSFLAARYETRSFRMTSAGGSFWACVSGNCAVQQRNRSGVATAQPGELVLTDTTPGFSGYYFIGEMSASHPPHESAAREEPIDG